LSEGAKVLKPLVIPADEHAKLAVVTMMGRLLIFPVLDLPALSKGKGNKLIQIPSADFKTNNDGVVTMTIFSAENSLKIVSGKRFVSLKSADIEHYTAARAKRGTPLPRGFMRVDNISVES
jgi:topoisomerase IV subunit A